MNNMDVHEIYVWHSLIDHSVFETHIFEHVLYRYIDEEMKQSGLDQQGIIIQSETFLDGTYTEIFFTKKKFSEMILDILSRFQSSLNANKCRAWLSDEYSRLKVELKDVDATEEDFALYRGLKSHGYELQQLYEFSEEITIEDIYDHFLKSSPLEVFEYSTDIVTKCCDLVSKQSLEENHWYSMCSGQQNQFEYFSFSFSPARISDYECFLFLTFLLGMNENSLIQRKIVEPLNLYLGYSVPVVTDNCCNILCLISGTSGEAVNIIRSAQSLGLSESEFMAYREAFKTYSLISEDIQKNVRDIVRLGFSSYSPVKVSALYDEIDDITLNDVNIMFRALTGVDVLD